VEEQRPEKIKKFKLIYLVIIVLTYEIVQLVYGAFTFITVHGIFTSRSIWDGQGRILAGLLIAAPAFYTAIYYNDKSKKISNCILWACYTLMLVNIGIALISPYQIGSDPITLHRSRSIFVINRQIIYSLNYFLFLAGAFIICMPKQNTFKNLILFIIPSLLTIIIWIILNLNVPPFTG
jgi:hypothetical protein